jgi:DNA-binding CsgD family transcriptional regulator
MNDEPGRTVERLTQGQIDCLMLVHQNLTSKEIAPILGISSHTVDKRIRASLRILGCENRATAARFVASQRDPAPAFRWHHTEADALVEAAVPEPFQTPARVRPKWGIRLPFATTAHPVNDMSFALRLLWIGLIACLAAFSVGMYMAGLESLARLMNVL